MLPWQLASSGFSTPTQITKRPTKFLSSTQALPGEVGISSGEIKNAALMRGLDMQTVPPATLGFTTHPPVGPPAGVPQTAVGSCEIRPSAASVKPLSTGPVVIPFLISIVSP